MSILCSMVGASFTVAAAAEIIRRKKGITAVGNAQIDTAQSKFGGSSALFDGTGDYLVVDPATDFAFGTNNFTIEMWVRFNSLPSAGSYVVFYDHRPTNESGAYITLTLKGSTVVFYAGADRITSGTITTGTWYHLALSRSGTSTKMFIDGTQAGSTYSDSTSYLSTKFYVGGDSFSSTSVYNGWLDEIRVSNTARYTANFTPPTTPFVNDNNTLLLIHANGTDASTFFEDDNGVTPVSTRTAKTITPYGNAQIDTAQSKFGGSSLLLDGNGDYLLTPYNSEFSFTGDFTIETQIRFNVINSYNGILTSWDTGWYLAAWGSSGLYFYANNTQIIAATGLSLTTGTWYHIAVSRSGSTVKLFLNGTQIGSNGTLSGTVTTDDPVAIGCNYAASASRTDFVNGWMDEVRISNSARYTANFTAPTAPFTNDPTTLLLVHCDGEDASVTFTDDTLTYRTQIGIFATGNAQIDTAQSQFGGSSALFDGTGDYLTCATPTTAFDFSSGNFTIEYWLRLNTASATIVPIAGRYSGSIFPGQWWCELTPDNKMYWGFKTQDGATTYYPGDGSLGGVFATGTWYHIAVVRNGNSMQMYRNGTAYGSAQSVSGSFGYTGDIWVGSLGPGGYGLNGWIDEVRVSKNARYTANFTAPTAPFVNDANTVLLIHADGTDSSTVFRDDNGVRSQKGIQALGNAQIDTAQSKFGGSSALFDGTGDYLASTSSDFDFQSDFTIEGWFRPTVDADTLFSTAQTTSSNGFWISTWNSASIIVGYKQSAGGGVGASTTSANVLTYNSWNHVAFSRSGTTAELYVNGVRVWNVSNFYNTATSPATIEIGRGRSISDGSWNASGLFEYAGHVDEFRVSNIRRYSGATSFTAPTAPFSNDANTLLLLHCDGTDASTAIFDDNGQVPQQP